MLHRHATLLTLLLALLLGGCGTFTPDPYPPFRYRMTVEVETPEGLRSGSVVREVDMTDTSNNAGFADIKFKVRGEAIGIDLPDGRVIFALLSSEAMEVDYASRIPMVALMTAEEVNSPEFKASFDSMIANRRAADLPRRYPKTATGYVPSGWPLLVTFRDLHDSETVVRVDPDNAASQLGGGITIKRITLQITDDPVTFGIEKRLPWLPKHYDRMLDNRRITVSRELANNLSVTDFSTEIRP